MTALITSDELKAYSLPVKENQWEKIGDDQIDFIIDAASTAIEDWLDVPVASAYYVERYPGRGYQKLVLDKYPVISLQGVSSVTRREVSATWAPNYFVINQQAGIIFWADREFYSFYDGYDYIVSYRAGFLTTPTPIKHAVALQTVQMLQPMFRGGSNWTDTKLIPEINEQIVDILEKYKRKRIG